MERILILLTMLAGHKELKLDAANQKTAQIHVKLMHAKATNVKIMQHVYHRSMLVSLAIVKAIKLPAGLDDIAKQKVLVKMLCSFSNWIYTLTRSH